MTNKPILIVLGEPYSIFSETLFKLYKSKIYKKLKPDIVHHFGIRQIVHGNIAARLAGIKKSYNSITGLGSVFISGNIILKFFIHTIPPYIPSHIADVFTEAGRMEGDKHYLSDVIMGAVLGA